MKKIISYSLYGKKPLYTLGAIQNAKDAHIYYPGWITRFYCDQTVPQDVLHELRIAGAEIIQKKEIGDNRGMFWRFEALEDPDVERVIVRDADSRLSLREAKAVEEWVSSALPGHIMRDHPWHGMVMLGGMWGCTTACLSDIKNAIERFNAIDQKNQDQLFLAKNIYPILIKKGCIIHDSFFHYESFSKDFPLPRCPDYSFVGEIIDENGNRNDDWKAIKKLETNLVNRIQFIWQHKKRKIKNKLTRKHIYI